MIEYNGAFSALHLYIDVVLGIYATEREVLKMRLKCLIRWLRSVCAILAIVVIALIPPTEVAAQELELQPELIMFYTDVDVWHTARAIDSEYRGCTSYKERASVAWTICNRARDGRWPSNITEVIFQPYQFWVAGMPAEPSAEALEIARDVLERWNLEMNGATDVGRTIPPEVCYFKGDGVKNHFSDQNWGGNIYEPVLGPYDN